MIRRIHGNTIKMKREKDTTYSYTPASPNQQKYVDILSNKNNSLIFGIGPAGSGKTLFACIEAIKSLKAGDIKKIIITTTVKVPYII